MVSLDIEILADIILYHLLEDADTEEDRAKKQQGARNAAQRMIELGLVDTSAVPRWLSPKGDLLSIDAVHAVEKIDLSHLPGGIFDPFSTTDSVRTVDLNAIPVEGGFDPLEPLSKP